MLFRSVGLHHRVVTVEAILYRDYPVVQTNVMLVAGTLVSLNLLVDLTYAWLDPRIRYQ